MVPALQMGKLRHREVKQPSQGPYTGWRKVSSSVLPGPKVFHRSLNLQTQKEMGRACHGEGTEPEDHHRGQEPAWPCRGTLTIPITRRLSALACLVFLLRKKGLWLAQNFWQRQVSLTYKMCRWLPTGAPPFSRASSPHFRFCEQWLR